jgi:hypothetical protein
MASYPGVTIKLVTKELMAKLNSGKVRRSAHGRGAWTSRSVG